MPGGKVPKPTIGEHVRTNEDDELAWLAEQVGDQVRHQVDDRGVATITLNRPDEGNALSPPQRDAVIELLARAHADLGIRAVVLTGSGRSFCSGADLRHPVARSPRPDGAPNRAVGDMSRLIAEGAQRLVGAVMDCDKPVVASVNGVAAGIGAHLALACDFVVAARSARFIEVFVRRGIIPDAGGIHLLPRLVGLRRAKELVLLGDDLHATEAEEIGLINRAVDDEELDAAVGALTDRLAVAPTRALASAKALLNRSFETPRAVSFAEEARAQELVLHTEDAAEGMASFAQRRDPRFRGW